MIFAKASNKFILFFLIVFSILSSFVLCFAESQSGERILDYSSDIIVNKDSSMLVTETIKVQAESININHGIYRDFPTKYKDSYGNNYSVDFDVLSVLKDDSSENFWTENISNGVRVYIGNKTVSLSPGIYTYTIKYSTSNQLGFFKDHDELFWNVTGNGWIFPIDKASARVALPSEISSSSLKTTGFTGAFGSTSKNFNSYIGENGKVSFSTTSSLAPKEGLTIVVEWPKNIVTEPSFFQRILKFLKDNLSTLFAILAVLALLVYYIIVWIKVGKDPEKGTIIPLYSPPEGFSPAALRYVEKMGFDNKALAATIINMAVKGVIKITEEKVFVFGKKFTITKTGQNVSLLSKEEKEVYDSLFSGRESFTFKEENYATVQRAIQNLTSSLKSSCENIFFNSNKGYYTTGFTYMIFLFVILYFLPKGLFSSNSIFVFSIALLLMLIINTIFAFLIKAPTKEGRKLLDQIAGFRMYLSYAEKDELNFSAPVEKTPELFEKYLPYALALDVENQWAEKFTDVLSRAIQEDNYHPTWYYGSSLSALSLANFGSSLGNSLTQSISSSSTPPGSSSGGGGGGFSGGGGGGGGGGGW